MTNNITIDRIVSTLEGKRTGSGWLCRCPAHADNSPSLSVSESSAGKPLFKCHAGCAQDAVLSALKVRGLWEATAIRAPEKRTEYIYQDSAGAPALKVTRVDRDGRKQIFQSRMEDGRWVSGGAKCELKPYKAEFWEGEDRRVFLVEGEKCADILFDKGLRATTTPGGAKKWLPSFAKYFSGRHVTILPDNDQPGREYASAAYRDIKAVAQSVQIIELPSLGAGEDVYDWLHGGHDVSELKDLVSAPPTETSALQLAVTDAPVPDTPDDEELPPAKAKRDPWPKALASEAFHGIAGEFVCAVEGETESDTAAILTQFLVGFGNLIGRSTYVPIGASQHYANLFVALVGNSSVGRKGTAWDLVKLVLSRVDAQWWSDCRIFGLGSGEGLVAAVKDPDMPSAEELAKNHPKFETPRDKRGMVIEGEFGQVLKVFQREGGTLSPQVRNAWDSGDLRVTTKKDSLRSTGAHISIIGHITNVELRQLLSTSDMHNGVGNRFIWICTTRSKLVAMPKMPSQETLDGIVATLAKAAEFAKRQGEVRMNADAEALYRSIYEDLSRERPGMLGVLTGRCTAIILRLALIYAMLDRSTAIAPEHLRAAIAVWEYAEQSVAAIFGRNTGDRTADKLLAAIEDAPDGLTQTEIIADVFGGNIKKDKLSATLALLSRFGLVTSRKEKSAQHRTVIRWLSCSTNYEFNEPTDSKQGENSSNSYFVSQKQGEAAHVS